MWIVFPVYGVLDLYQVAVYVSGPFAAHLPETVPPPLRCEPS